MLFRPEALKARGPARLGSIDLHRPISLRLLTVLAVGAVVAVGAFLSLAEYTRKARVSGTLVPERGVLRLMVPQTATVLTRHVEEGQQVREGQLLYELALDGAGSDGEGIAQSLQERERSLGQAQQQQRELAQSRTQALQARLANTRRALEQTERQQALQAERLTLAQQALSRQETLARDQFVSSAQVQTKREEVLGLQAQQQGLAREREELHREVLGLQAELAALPLQTQVTQGELSRDIAALKAQGLESQSKRRLLLRAPSAGQMSTVLAQPGQVVPPNVSLASLLPAHTALQAHLYAPSSAVGFVRPQQRVLLRYQAFPYQKFGQQEGEVLQVSRTPLAAAELAQLGLPTALAQGEPLYRITVQLRRQSVNAYGQEQDLSPGMLLEADVLLERRRLIEWIFEPLLSLARRV